MNAYLVLLKLLIVKHLVTITVILLLSCAAPPENADTICYRESRFSFYDPFNKEFTIHTWIRKAENIRTLHETFKKYGYNKIFPDYDLTSNPCMIWSFINKPCRDIIDSLIIAYPNIETSPTYYREFWNRRKNEQNDTTVFTVLKK